MSNWNVIGETETGKQIIEIDFNQEAADELNELQEELFGHLDEDTKKALKIKKYKPQKLRALFG